MDKNIIDEKKHVYKKLCDAYNETSSVYFWMYKYNLHKGISAHNLIGELIQEMDNDIRNIDTPCKLT